MNKIIIRKQKNQYSQEKRVGYVFPTEYLCYITEEISLWIFILDEEKSTIHMLDKMKSWVEKTGCLSLFYLN